ncbi:hypothetical protein ARMSODRAFT_886591 [Armillaria solidipes]|uniref:Uncharacterized protein n=1 Tax=Armillaria solidipes TaxID=1076256 RepID=A0A2H3BJF7_9AGAR|nr:hypothetical protein ARMSODRAFT_886591 [Armillaria solidipes]
MSTYPPHTKKIRRCFFFSLAFVIVIPIICIVLGLKLHPQEFAYSANDAASDGSTRKIYLHADLISADLKQGTVVLDWSVLDDTCELECTDANDACLSKCTVVNIYFDIYFTGLFGFAEDASNNATVLLSLEDTSGLVVAAEFAQAGIPERIAVTVTLQRGTLVKWYCVIITITFWLVTLMICLVMIMTVGFGFQQRNEIVVVPVATVFAFTQLRSTMPGAPEGFDADFVGVLPCLVLLSISAVTMVGIYIFTDPAKDSREKLTWSALGTQVLDGFYTFHGANMFFSQ